MLSAHDAHLATGMKVSEIADIEEVDGGYLVTTHDGQTIDLEAVPERSAPGPDRKPEPEKKPTPSTARSGRGKG
jgi:hypothetical protein